MIDFDAKKHEYSRAGVIYDSVTKVIAKYENPFDSQYWSTYKGIKDVITERLGERAWKMYKQEAGGWENVVHHYSLWNHDLWREIDKRKNEYLHSWDVKAHNARVTGSAVHAWKEKAIKGKTEVRSQASGDTVTLYVSSGQLLRDQHFDGNRIYSELIISSDKYKIAGMADRVEKYSRAVHIMDYKTSGKIEKEAFMESKMKYPLDCLPDCNYSHFMMQFSTYGWMLEQQGFNVVALTLEHLIPPKYEDKDMVRIPVPYRPDLVEDMLNHYRGMPLQERKREKLIVHDAPSQGETFNFG